MGGCHRISRMSHKCHTSLLDCFPYEMLNRQTRCPTPDCENIIGNLRS